MAECVVANRNEDASLRPKRLVHSTRVAPLHGALWTQYRVFDLTAAYLTHSLRLCASSAAEKTSILPAVDEAKKARAWMW